MNNEDWEQFKKTVIPIKNQTKNLNLWILKFQTAGEF